jgi:bla regulator protein blaR1
MTALIVKSTVAMLAALLLVMIAHRSRASLRHLILAALFGFLLLLPAVQSIAPALQIPAPAAVGGWQLAVGGSETTPAEPAVANAAVSSPANHQLPTANWAARVYLAVAALLLSWLAIGVFRLRMLAARADVWLEGTARMNAVANEANIRRSALVVLSSEVSVPMTFGFRRSTIVMPEAALEWSAEELTRALRHELEHVRREDWALQLLARVACAFYWPHPLVWSAWRRFCLEAERACDDAVIRSSEPAAYAGQLLSLARNLRISTVPALGMASRSKLRQRVEAILDPKQPRGPHGGFSAAMVLMLSIALLVCVAPAKLIAAATDAVSFDPDPDIDFDFDIDSKMGEIIVRTAERGDIEKMKDLMRDGVDINTVALGDGTALIGAARAGQERMVEFLLSENADPNLAARGDGNPLIAAAGAGELAIVEMLLDAGADRDTIVPGDENPLMQAAWHGHADVVRFLLDRGADANARAFEDGEIRTPLILARRGGYEDIAQMLVDAGAEN